LQLFATDRDRLEFLLEAEAELRLDPERLSADARQAAGEGERPRYVTNYIGSKQKLVEWIWKNTPEAVESVVDAFSGSAVVAYMYKSRGLKVVANDRLRYAWHTARAIIENDKATLGAEEIDALLADNPKAGTFVHDTFKGLFFEEGVHAVIDAIRANCDALSGYKKDLALFALGKSCASGGFGHFTSTQESGLRKGGPDDFRERFRRNAERINALVFANGEACKALCRDVNEVLPETKADLAYFDPPYATEFSTTNYERAYHFVEGLMTYWEGLKIVGDSKTRFFESDHETVTKGNAKAFFERVLGGAKHLGHWLISYRDHAYPNEEEMKAIIAALGREATLKSTDHQYLISGQNNEASKAKEYLFICSREGAGAEAALADAGHEDAVEERRIEDNLAALADAPLGEAVDLLSCMAADSEPVRVTGYLGSKFVLLGWMEKLLPKDAKSVLDAFSGGANVAYHLKRKGLKVYANDLLRFPYHLARAVVENSAEKLTDEEIDRILAPNPDAGSFIEQTFHGYYYTKPVLRWLDQVWANIQRLPGYKKDIALAALGTTVKAKSAFGHFTRSKMQRKGELDASASLEQSQLSNPSVAKFVESFRRSAKQLNALVFDNGQECRAFNLEASEAVKRLGADLLYLDPPYVTDFATNDYEDALHFVEGLMTRWADKELLDNPRKSFRSRTRYNKESMRELMETLAAGARGRFGSVALSYRDKAHPDEESIKAILGEHYAAVKVHGMEVDYNIAKDIAKEGGHARELLFLASRPRGTARSKAACGRVSGCHTSFPVEIALRARALDLGAARTADPQFTFTLCRVGTNRNGDHFTAEELSGRCATAVNKKIDLQHSQEFSDIVGGIVSADYVEDGSGGRVECVGELYTGESEQARLAHKLIRKGIISQVSMECDYAEGECSVCGKRVKSKADYCVHLAKHKGAELQGKPVFEILHGVTFTGLGLLDRKGADENARITQVASEHATTQKGASTMEGKQARGSDAAKRKGDEEDDDVATDDKDRIRELERENGELKAQVSELQKRIQELEAEQKAAANRSRADKLLRRLEGQGLAFGSGAERDAELGRLAKLGDEAFAATEAAYERAVPKRADATEKARMTKAREDGEQPLRSDAGVRPLSIDDKKLSLEDRLKSGFRAAHDARRARLAGASADTD
jgi:adenine-specific DNA-methyltransferase